MLLFVTAKDGEMKKMHSGGVPGLGNRELVVKKFYDHNKPILVMNPYQRKTPNEIKSCLLPELGGYYQLWGQYGPYGDVLQVLRRDNGEVAEFFLIGIYSLAYLAPKLAADLVVFVRDNRDRRFYVGVIRGKEPGKGKPAMCGGFRDKRGFEFESAWVTAVREAREEIGLIVKVISLLSSEPYPWSLPCEYLAKGIRGHGALRLVSVPQYTGKEEEHETSGEKRVDEFAAYVLEIKVNEILTKENIRKMFCPGDDAGDVFVYPVIETMPERTPDFYFSHHAATYRKALQLCLNENVLAFDEEA